MQETSMKQAANKVKITSNPAEEASVSKRDISFVPSEKLHRLERCRALTPVTITITVF
jgi:hypothetical protein